MKSPEYYFNFVADKLNVERVTEFINQKPEFKDNCLEFTERQWCEILGQDISNVGLGALVAWGYNKGIYQFGSELVGELCTSCVEVLDQHIDIFDSLPQQCLYIKLANVAGGPMEFWALKMGDTLQLVQNHPDSDPTLHRLDLSNGTSFTSSIEVYRQELENRWSDQPDAKDMSINFSYYILLMVKSLAYLCTKNRDLLEIYNDEEILRSPVPVAAEPFRLQGSWVLNPASKVRTWSVGETIAEQLVDESSISISHWKKHTDGSFSWLFGRESEGENFEDYVELPTIYLDDVFDSTTTLPPRT